jgi:hypothetical protein
MNNNQLIILTWNMRNQTILCSINQSTFMCANQFNFDQWLFLTQLTYIDLAQESLWRSIPWNREHVSGQNGVEPRSSEFLSTFYVLHFFLSPKQFLQTPCAFLGCGQWPGVTECVLAFFTAFSEPGVSTCRGRTPWRRGARPLPPCPQTSWAALSAWTLSPTAARLWVSPFHFLVWPATTDHTLALVLVLGCLVIVCDSEDLCCLLVTWEPIVRVSSCQNKDTIHKHKVNLIKSGENRLALK